MKPVPSQVLIRIAAVVVTLALIGCSSRYRLNLAVIEGGEHRQVQVEQTQFARRAVLGDPRSETQILPGEGNCVIVIAGARKRTLTSAGKYEVLTYDDHLQYRLYVQLPANLSAGRLPLADYSFVQIMGRYELRQEEKFFTQATGTLVIDSLAHRRAFISIDGEFQNQSGATIEVKGEFKVKIK